MKTTAIFVALLLALLASACIEDGGGPSTASPTTPVVDGSRPTATPGATTPVCAAVN